VARAIRAFFKAVVAVLAAGLLAKFLWDRFSRPSDAGSDAPDSWQQREPRETSTVEGEERTDRTTEREDELRVQRTEEELAAGTREREAGEVRVQKDVRTDRETVEVPTRHEEVTVERVPVEEGTAATEAQIGDEEVSVPVTEEEVVVEKRPVVKEEVRIRKDVVEDTEVVEEDLRREEIDIDDQTTRRDV
jgi:uncharacterized protein (TIGR02271 family)